MSKEKTVPISTFICLLLHMSAQADLFQSAVTEADIDFENCRTYIDGKPQAVSEKTLKAVFEFTLDHGEVWRGGHARGDGSKTTFMYLVSFKHPVEVGSMLLSGTADEVYFLKNNATTPPDPSKPDEWNPIEMRPRQSGAGLATLPVGTKTTAVLIIDENKHWWSQILSWQFFKQRLHNLANNSTAFAEAEYTAYSDLAPPYHFGAWRISQGQGEWRSAGKDKVGKTRAAPLSPDTPVWLMLAWQKEQTVEGFWLLSNFRSFKLFRYRGPESIHPRAGTADEWKEVKEFSFVKTARRGSTFVRIDEPVTTRGLKISITGVHGHEDNVARLEGLHAIVDLQDNVVPALDDMEAADPGLPPVTVDYELPWEGMVTVAIDGEDGKRVRNLVSRAEVLAGKHQAAWNLTNDNGVSVKPGNYKAKIIAHPPLSLGYQFTVYPNVSQLIPGNAAWQNGTHGPGGWLADHSSPSSFAVAKDTIYIGSPVAESGVSLIEADLNGAKRWGYHTLHEGFGGPWFLAADNKKIYAAARGTMLWSFDMATKEKTNVLDRAETARRKDQITGMAARDGKIYLAQGANPWLANALSPDDVDIDACLPRHLLISSGASWPM